MNTIQAQKKALRQAVREKARLLDAEHLRDGDRRIQERLLALCQWRGASVVFVYVSVGREPDTVGIIRAAFDGKKRVAIPRCLGGGVMEAREITSMEGLRPGRMGILEPDATHRLVRPEEIDLVVAPCVAVDRRLRRLGNGGGYFDRYFPKVRCPVVCLCREECMLEEVPADALDVPVGMVITERGIYGGDWAG